MYKLYVEWLEFELWKLQEGKTQSSCSWNQEMPKNATNLGVWRGMVSPSLIRVFFSTAANVDGWRIAETEKRIPLRDEFAWKHIESRFNHEHQPWTWNHCLRHLTNVWENLGDVCSDLTVMLPSEGMVTVNLLKRKLGIKLTTCEKWRKLFKRLIFKLAPGSCKK